jgi:hypothetical protein
MSVKELDAPARATAEPGSLREYAAAEGRSLILGEALVLHSLVQILINHVHRGHWEHVGDDVDAVRRSLAATAEALRRRIK